MSLQAESTASTLLHLISSMYPTSANASANQRPRPRPRAAFGPLSGKPASPDQVPYGKDGVQKREDWVGTGLRHAWNFGTDGGVHCAKRDEPDFGLEGEEDGKNWGFSNPIQSNSIIEGEGP
ncbi:hypothetical protein N7450_001670 [Penicillium hetheringtonii]|uniref:Uncharacterized protein n=1 Tax=Penicillium hetheringtonii TaxID=911720 RepID=A0AAD6H2K7_9EURO|nr:hypothetical protein N7450_001670 [Penicillium hetheringtonii]